MLLVLGFTSCCCFSIMRVQENKNIFSPYYWSLFTSKHPVATSVQFSPKERTLARWVASIKHCQWVTRFFLLVGLYMIVSYFNVEHLLETAIKYKTRHMPERPVCFQCLEWCALPPRVLVHRYFMIGSVYLDEQLFLVRSIEHFAEHMSWEITVCFQ